MRRNGRAAWSAFLGVLASLILPVAVYGTRYSSSYSLLDAGFAIPFAVVLGLAAILLSRRARELERLTLRSADGAKAGRIGRLLGILGLCLAASATIALAVYQLLVAVE